MAERCHLISQQERKDSSSSVRSSSETYSSTSSSPTFTYHSFPDPEGEAPLQQLSRNISLAKKHVDPVFFFGSAFLAVLFATLVICLCAIPFPVATQLTVHPDDQILVPHNSAWMDAVTTEGPSQVAVYWFQGDRPRFLPAMKPITRSLPNTPIGQGNSVAFRFYLYEGSLIDAIWDFGSADNQVTFSIIRGAAEYAKYARGSSFDAVLRKTSNRDTIKSTVTKEEEYFIVGTTTLNKTMRGSVTLNLQTKAFDLTASSMVCSGDCMIFLAPKHDNFLLYAGPVGPADGTLEDGWPITSSERPYSGKYAGIYASLATAIFLVAIALVLYRKPRLSDVASWGKAGFKS